MPGVHIVVKCQGRGVLFYPQDLVLKHILEKVLAVTYQQVMVIANRVHQNPPFGLSEPWVQGHGSFFPSTQDTMGVVVIVYCSKR